MVDIKTAVTLLRHLRPLSRVVTPVGDGLVLAQMRDKVTVLVGGVVVVFERYECEGVS